MWSVSIRASLKLHWSSDLGKVLKCTLTAVSAYEYRLTVPSDKAVVVATWLRDLTDGYVVFDQDVEKKLPGLTEVEISTDEPVIITEASTAACCKPYYVGIEETNYNVLPEFHWEEKEAPLRRTPIFETHRRLGAKIIPFAGWEMPVWYSSVMDEHLAVRNAAGFVPCATWVCTRQRSGCSRIPG